MPSSPTACRLHRTRSAREFRRAIANVSGLRFPSAARIDKISVSRAAAALIERGLIAARDNPGDGRSHLLALTEDGRALYAEIAPVALAMEAELLSSLSCEERALLDGLLRRIEAAAGTDFP
jgi:hypothetical protein